MVSSSNIHGTLIVCIKFEYSWHHGSVYDKSLYPLAFNSKNLEKQDVNVQVFHPKFAIDSPYFVANWIGIIMILFYQNPNKVSNTNCCVRA